MAAASSLQLGFWQGNAALYRRALEVTEDNWAAMNNYGVVLMETDLAGAVPLFQRSMRLKPDHFEARMNLANALSVAAVRRLTIPDVPDPAAEAEAAYRLALAQKPGFPEAALRLSNHLSLRGRRAEAAAVLEDLVRRHPDLAAGHVNLAILLSAEGRTADAERHHREAIRLEPSSSDAHFNYGVTLEFAGRMQEARSEYLAAVRLDPGHGKAKVRLGNLERSR
jgi:Flp pilus assembly protein TadD